MSANVLNYFDKSDASGNNPLNLTGDNNVFVPSASEQKYGTWVDGKVVYRKIVNFGALPNSTTKNVAHGITSLNLNGYIKAELVAYKDSPAADRPIFIVGPGAGYAASGELTLSIDATNVIATNSVNDSAYTNGYVVLYYTKS